VTIHAIEILEDEGDIVEALREARDIDDDSDSD
jgi:hypothetical protein